MFMEKNNKHKEFWRDAPWCVSSLSRGHVPSVPSYLPTAPGTFCPSNMNFHINRPKRPGCPGTSRIFPWESGTLPGHSDHQIPSCDLFLSGFSHYGRERLVLKKGGFVKGRISRMCFTPFLGIKVHPPHAVALFKGKFACGRCTFTPEGFRNIKKIAFFCQGFPSPASLQSLFSPLLH